jgi:hypothetical protein
MTHGAKRGEQIRMEKRRNIFQHGTVFR